MWRPGMDGAVEQLRALKERVDVLNELMSRPEVLARPTEYQRYAREHAEVSRLLGKVEKYVGILKTIEGDESLLKDQSLDAELRELAQGELRQLKEQRSALEQEIRGLLLPKDVWDSKNVIMEIRAGTGGEEAALFAADLYRMYAKYAESQGWRVEALSSHPTGLGGFKEVVLSIEGEDVHSKLKYESGTHRVQRVPETEASGRIHTSAVTVAILPEAEEVEVVIDPGDIRIDVFRSTGPGGQSVNTTDSAVRVTHLPTGMVVTCQDEKSQHKNRAKAMKVLRARLLDMRRREEEERRSRERRMQIGSGDRSERIRTYNFPQSRLTDHRINFTLYRLEEILEGRLEPVIEALQEADRKVALERAGQGVQA